MASNQLSGNLDLLLLSVLTAGEAHGYAVITRLRERSDGAFDLPEGTVYPALHRLERDGLLTSRWDRGSGRRRRAYALTQDGHRALEQKRRSWHDFSRGVRAVIDPGVPRATVTP
ncbi:PadR family transcriptional regulator [Nocardioides guangzhouensis]|uniref:PadR family transcriptional regulator n=1 Tax=Nocardioides guangzhouensis TaxID=2497878 RepID=A0A4Q4ZCP6_9ACTN|nr:PadR family transcriptional regulator [Nocardioides guangzhouensis]RYP85830.1 PadR family transcriptional regulator [Nocardioides guangzhouensis]